jgi:hypothetical protein
VALTSLGVVGAALVVAVVVLSVRGPAAGPTTYKEILVERSTNLDDATIVFSISQGASAARVGSSTGVMAEADLRFPRSGSGGTAEIRVREPGEVFGVLALAPDLAGATRVHLQGQFPEIDRGSSKRYEVWVHLTLGALSYDTDAVTVEVQGVPGGERAVIR